MTISFSKLSYNKLGDDVITATLTAFRSLSKPFWVVWAIELWERFGYYGVQAIFARYFVLQLGYSEHHSTLVFGSFAAFVYGFIWIGGWLGDSFLGAKRTLLLGAIILMLSYAGLALSNQYTVFYALAGIIVGNALFKANPSSLISKLYNQGDAALDAAMTLYYMAINIGAMVSLAISPIVAHSLGWEYAFMFSSAGLLLGILSYLSFYDVLLNVNSPAGKKPLSLWRLGIVILGSALAIGIIAQLLEHTLICSLIVYTVVSLAFLYFIYTALQLNSYECKRMLVAFVLILQGVLFFVLYNQMPTSMTFFAVHNVNNVVWGWHIPPSEYQVLNSIFIVILSPLLAWGYHVFRSTHVTKFCLGMTLCAISFILLGMPQFFVDHGLISPIWMVVVYFFQSAGELLISGLGLAMVAELCPPQMSGYVMGVWWLTSMLAGPLGAWIGSMAVPDKEAAKTLTTMQSLHVFGHVFLGLGLLTAGIALFMWRLRPYLNKLLAAQ